MPAATHLQNTHTHTPLLSQVLFVLMNGAGVGFSVEPRYVDLLPCVAETFVQTSRCAGAAAWAGLLALCVQAQPATYLPCACGACVPACTCGLEAPSNPAAAIT